MPNTRRLHLLPTDQYVGVTRDDPIRFYRWPVIGRLYRRRVEWCLNELSGGQSILEVGFGSGLALLNLSELYREIHGLDLTADAKLVQANFAARGVKADLRSGSVLRMPYGACAFDSVLLISVLEHLRPSELPVAMAEIARVLRPGGQCVYGVPVERPLMTWAFRVLGYDIHRHHFSTHEDVASAAADVFAPSRVLRMKGIPAFSGAVYEVGHFLKRS
jgi:SAM-dependent methyltransferase